MPVRQAEGATNFHSGFVQLRLCRSHAYAEQSGDLIVAIALDIVQDKYGAIPAR